jgi:hypothetical protein
MFGTTAVPAISTGPVETGHRMAIVGFPRSDARILFGTLVEHFAGAAGEKHIVPARC